MKGERAFAALLFVGTLGSAYFLVEQSPKQEKPVIIPVPGDAMISSTEKPRLSLTPVVRVPNFELIPYAPSPSSTPVTNRKK